MPEQLAYDITRLLFEKQADLVAIHPQARDLSLATRRSRIARAVSSGRHQVLHGEERLEAVGPDRGHDGHRCAALTTVSARRSRRSKAKAGRATLGGWIGTAHQRSRRSALSLYSLYWVVGIVQPQIYRVSFLLVSLVLIFLLFRGTPIEHAGHVRSTGSWRR